MALVYWRNFERQDAGRVPVSVGAPGHGAEAHIDSISPNGLIAGWARMPGILAPALIEVWLEGILLGQIGATSFRADLLAAGMGHGHYGFRFQIKPGQPLQGMLQIREATTGQILVQRRLTGATVVPASPAGAQTVESLLGLSGQWSWSDLWSAAPAFDFECDCQTLGDRRFVAVVFWFLQGRWPSEDEYVECLGNLRRRVWSAQAFFLHVLGARDPRRGRKHPQSPYDGGFPFRTLTRGSVGGAMPPAVDCANLLATAILASPPWPEEYPELKFDDKSRRLLCHPPAQGVTLARIDHLAISAPCQVRLQASLDHVRSAAVEFAIILAPTDSIDAEIYRQFQAGEGLGQIWQRVSSGESSTLTAESAAASGPVRLYVATRMAPTAKNNYFAWAHLSNLSVAASTGASKNPVLGSGRRFELVGNPVSA